MNTSQHRTKPILDFWKGKRVLLTGGTRGLGRALALQLADLHAKVTIVARSQEDLLEIQENNHQIFTIAADVSNKDDIHRISGQTIGMMEGIDVLINNASYLGPTPLRSLLDTECEELEKTLQTNIIGPFRLIKAIIPYMKFHNFGLIINISSDAAIHAYKTWGPYSISKAALDHLTAIWQEELEDDPIQVISIDPGDMATDMHFKAIPDANPDDLYNPEEVAQDLLQFLIRSSFSQTRYSASEWREFQ